MDSAGYYWGLYRGYCKDPFPHSLLSTSQFKDSIHGFQSLTGFKVQLFCWGGGVRCHGLDLGLWGVRSGCRSWSKKMEV